MSDLFPSFFDGRKTAPPPAAFAATAARELRQDDLQRIQQMQQPAMAEIGHGGSPRAADAASAAGRERGYQADPKAATVLAATAPWPPPPPPRPAHRAQLVSDALAWQPRAISLERDAGFPYEGAEPFAKLLCGEPPGDYDAGYWERALEGAVIFAPQWAAVAYRAGWSLESVFGLDDIAPARRHDRKGLAWLLTDGKHVVALAGIPPRWAAFSKWREVCCCAAKSALSARLAAQHGSDDIDHGRRTASAMEQRRPGSDSGGDRGARRGGRGGGASRGYLREPRP